MKSLCASCVVLASLATSATADEAEEIKKLVPSAAAMSAEDFKKLATSASPRETDVEEKSLTLMILNLKDDKDDDEAAIEQFRFNGEAGVAKASELAAEIYRVVRIGKLRIPRGPVTAIHADRITMCTCEVDGDRATGTVSFRVPDLYQGKADYLARREGDQWKIVELSMIARDIQVVRDDDGKWKKKPAE